MEKPNVTSIVGSRTQAAPPLSAAARSANLTEQARKLAQEALNDLLWAAAALEADATALTALEALPPGVRERLRRVAADLADFSQGVEAIRGRK